MHIINHALPPKSAGVQRHLQSLHFGSQTNLNKVYIQASLHADEIPGMLVSHYLRQRLQALEAQDAIQGQIVLVPVANPIGLAQDIQGSAFGRFDLASGINFNRGYQHLTPKLLPRVREQLSQDARANQHVIRQTAAAILAEQIANNETDALKLYLQSLAIDADIVLDLHCDHQAVMHLYTGEPLAERGVQLASYLQAHAVLVTKLPGDDPFDDSCSRHWWELQEQLGSDYPIPLACLSVTVELRGESDVMHHYAEQDADALISFLQAQGHIATRAQGVQALAPAAAQLAQCRATPLEGVEPIAAPHGGILVFVRELGENIQQGEPIADLIDPLSGQVTALCATVSGVMFARIARRYVHAGTRIAKIAGSKAYRSGNLLSA